MNGNIANKERFQRAIALFDKHNAADPNVERTENGPEARELFFAARLTEWVERLKPDASEALQLAARCQHICRWEIPRSDYPMNRAGYLQWRTKLKSFHAEKAGAILKEVGYDEEKVRQVKELNLKKNFPKDPDSQVLEDALCLVFLQFQFAELAQKAGEEKTVNALRKSWGKMSKTGRKAALRLKFGPREKGLLEKALTPGGDRSELVN